MPTAREELEQPKMPTTREELDRAVRLTMSVKEESPLNFHQATIYYCCVSDEAPLQQKLGYFAVSAFLVVLQCGVVAALFLDLMGENSGCRTNADCITYSTAGASYCSPYIGRCESCTCSIYLSRRLLHL